MQFGYNNKYNNIQEKLSLVSVSADIQIQVLELDNNWNKWIIHQSSW